MSAVIKANKVKLNDYGYEIDKTIPEIEKRENEPKNEQIKTDNIDWKAIVVETVDELREEYEREIENLKKEVIDAHKLVTEMNISVESNSKIVMISDGKMKELELPKYGSIVIKVVDGKITKYDVTTGELF